MNEFNRKFNHKLWSIMAGFQLFKVVSTTCDLSLFWKHFHLNSKLVLSKRFLIKIFYKLKVQLLILCKYLDIATPELLGSWAKNSGMQCNDIKPCRWATQSRISGLISDAHIIHYRRWKATSSKFKHLIKLWMCYEMKKGCT